MNSDKYARFNYIVDKIINFGIENNLLGQGYGDNEKASEYLNEIIKYLIEEIL